MKSDKAGFGIQDSGFGSSWRIAARPLNPASRIPHPDSRITNPASCILHPERQKGFTLMELVVVISLVGILASMLFSRVLFYQELAEKSAMQQVVSALQSALVMQYGHRMANSTGSEINGLSTENPMDWLAQKPVNYAGAFKKVKPGAIESGNWAFDLNTHELIYLPNHDQYFVPAADGNKWIRFRTRFGYDNMPGSRVKGARELTSVIFGPVEPYQWLILEKQ